MNKDIESVLVSEFQIEHIVHSLATQIQKDYANTDFVMIGLLKGSISFMSDLMKCIDLNFSVDFMTVSSYGAGVESSGNVKIVRDLTSSIKDKEVLVVEDIIDSGNTLAFVCSYLVSKGAKRVRVVTMCDKPSRRKVEFAPDYKGITVPDKFIVGYGMDYAEKYRNLPYIGILRSSVYM